MKTMNILSEQKIENEDMSKIEPVVTAEQARTVVAVFVLSALCMSACLGMVAPVFAHLLKETSSGIRALGFMMMVPQIALLVLSPFVGGLADRYGRRPFLLLGFAGLVLTNTASLFTHSMAAYTGIRLVQAIVCVGIIPATMGMLADVVPEHQRTRRISLILAGHAGGMALGPVVGGFLLQHWGTAGPFGASALLNLVVLCFVCTMFPRISPTRMDQREAPGQQSLTRKRIELLVLSLMLPLSFLAGLLVLDFVSAFGRTFVEPQQALYLYKVLKFTPVQFGLLMSSRGLTMLLGQLVLSRWGDHVSRRTVIVMGILSHALFLFSLLFVHQFAVLFLVSLLAGVGGGMIHPLLSACYLDSTPPRHRSSVIGIKEAVGALGEIAGSLTVVLASAWLIPQRAFLLGGAIIAGSSLLAFFILKSPRASLAASSAPASEELLAEQPTLPLSRIQLADQPTLPLSRIQLAEQPTLRSKSIRLTDQLIKLPGLAFTGDDKGAWLL
jgi:DHA1 family quinolone resistance protein-like MFS transporter